MRKDESPQLQMTQIIFKIRLKKMVILGNTLTHESYDMTKSKTSKLTYGQISTAPEFLQPLIQILNMQFLFKLF